MKKIITILATLMLTSFSINLANAGGFTVGATASYMTIDASGSATEGDETTSANVDNNVVIGSIFAEYSFDDVSWGSTGNGVTLGAQYIPGAADVSDKVKTRTDTELSITGTTTGTSTSRTQTAQAEIEKYINYYIELPVWKSLYVKAGMASVDVNTLETTNGSNGGTYGNKTLDGTNLGIGVKGITSSNVVWKLAYEEVNFDTLNLTSTTSNTLKADLDTQEINLSVGYRF